MPHSPARVAALLVLLSGASLAWAQAQPPAKPPAKGPTTIDAESIEGVSEFEVTARGRAELRRDDIGVFGDLLRYNQEFGRIEADGGVRLERGSDRFFGPRLRYDTVNETGVFEEPTFILRREQTATGTAERLEFLGRDRLRLTRASFTTCQPGKEDWTIEARQLDLDYEKEEGTARDMRLRLLDTTIFALPYATFPLENRRKSGFLVPTFSQNTLRGVEVGAPYYFNISPEQDLVLTPHLMSKRGEQLKANYRYLGRDYNGQMRVEYMPEDNVLRRARNGVSYQHQHTITPHLTGLLDLNKVSDDRYLVDFATQVRAVSVGNLQRDGQLIYNNNLFGIQTHAHARVQRFQTLQDPLAPIVSPYHRLPQLTLSATKVDLAGAFDVALPAEYVRFSHASLIQGSRTTLNPSVSLPITGPAHFLTPKLGVRSTGYDLQRTAPGQPMRQSVNVPWLSTDAGLIFDRPLNLFGRAVTQTFEPRVFYLYVPYRAQDQLPLFDTALADFNYAQLFSENRFVGGDRFGDANQLTLAATSRLLGEDGQELLRATLGQRYHFKNERVALAPGAPLRSRDQSDIVASLGGRFAQSWTFDTTMQYNPQQSRGERYGATVRYSPEAAKVVNATYRFNRDLLRHVDLSGQWPVKAGWYGVARYNYSLRDHKVLEALAGVEYNAGCWVFRTVFQRFQAATQTTSTALHFQIEFNGLGQIGVGDTVDFLRRNVPGYARTNPSDPQLVPPSMRPRLPFEQVY
jgi:LPS-assembly protein